MDIIIKIIQFFLCFTILVGIHELGHFLMARVFKIRVDKFYIFFDPWFSLFKFKRGDTEYGLAAHQDPAGQLQLPPWSGLHHSGGQKGRCDRPAGAVRPQGGCL